MLNIEPIKITGPVDVLLETTSGVLEDKDGTSQGFDRPVELVDDVLHFGPIDDDLGEQILAACEPADLNCEATRQLSARTAFVRRVDTEELADHTDPWDRDSLIQRALALSRWIRPTGTGLDHIARVIPGGHGGKLQIVPATSYNLSPIAFVHPGLSNDRLTVDDAVELAGLLPQYLQVEAGLPARLRRAIWNHEYVRRTYFMNVAWHLVSASFEGLVNTGRDHVSQRFRERVAALAGEVGEPSMTEDRAKLIYGAIRSALAHGGEVVGMDDAQNLDHFELCMDVLRRVLRKCVEEPTFAAHFDDEESIRAWRPVSYKRKGKTVFV